MSRVVSAGGGEGGRLCSLPIGHVLLAMPSVTPPGGLIDKQMRRPQASRPTNGGGVFLPYAAAGGGVQVACAASRWIALPRCAVNQTRWVSDLLFACRSDPGRHCADL